jgi:hypothetical protein
MFADVEADVYVMVDGDATYDAGAARRLIDRLVATTSTWWWATASTTATTRSPTASRPPPRQPHAHRRRGAAVRWRLTDMLSGYRVFSRRYAKSFPALSRGFETETELTVHALELRMPYAEESTAYSTRPEGSHSKLSTYRDGWRILKTICKLFVSERPLQFFSIIAALLVAAVGRAGGAAVHDLHAHRPGAPAPHGGARHRCDAGRDAVLRVRHRDAHRHARAAGDQALRYLAIPGVRHCASANEASR